MPEHGLAAGDVGTVVHACKEGRSFTVEFTTDDGTTGALASVAADQIRPLARNEIHHARPFALAAYCGGVREPLIGAHEQPEAD